jgi:hypothetical protein
MEDPIAQPLSVPVPLPARGDSSRIRLGSSDLVLEHVRGGYSVLWSDGRQARRYALGLRADGALELHWRAPRLPVRCLPRDVLSVVPGGRLRGYVQVPLVPTILWVGADGGRQLLIERLPSELAAEWDDVDGHLFRTDSAWHVRFPMRTGDPRAVVPVILHNDDDAVLSPAHLPLQLLDHELVAMRGSVVMRPRRLRWLGTSWAEAPAREVPA